MITFLAAVPEYADDAASQSVWAKIALAFGADDGHAYYRYPVVRATSGAVPELAILTRSHQPLAVRCLPFAADQLKELGPDFWVVDDKTIDSPILELEDFLVGIKSALDRERTLRNRLAPLGVLSLPFIADDALREMFPDLPPQILLLGENSDVETLVKPLSRPLVDVEWTLARAVFQGVRPLSPSPVGVPSRAATLGGAIREAEKRIALFDNEQEKVAIPIAPGPQRIRGLAGTGKTVLLAMKAANIHKQYPERTLLFTFNTQSLYNQARTLITRFYRYHMDVDPNWDVVHVRHGWGGANRSGVYYDLCNQQGVPPLTFMEARRLDSRHAFRACCRNALAKPIDPTYDFILVDEAQDFPAEYFQVLHQLSREPHRIYWTYDELQSLTALQVPKPEDLFGLDPSGRPLVTLEGDDYPGSIEKDLILHRSYRCVGEVLVVAHAIGLGLYADAGPVQMQPNRESWEDIGYRLESGDLRTGESIVLQRPVENSPHDLRNYYSGSQDVLDVRSYASSNDEIEAVAQSVADAVLRDEVRPEDVVVIHLDARAAKQYLPLLQRRLSELNCDSIIPGVLDEAAAFAEVGRVTLTSVFRAKGNEAPLVFITGFDSLYDYVDPVEGRNRAFTAISRSKLFVRISGIGKQMERAAAEITRIRADYPYLRFVMPNMDDIRRLDARSAKRRRQVKQARDSAERLLKVDPAAIASLRRSDPKLYEELIRRISEMHDGHQ